jgi:hypothetical protein
MRFGKIVFTVAGIWGLLVLTPLFFTEHKFGQDYPPAITHPEFFYGFVCVAVAWQVAFLIIGRDPVRYRPLMIACMMEKFLFVIACITLYLQGRLTGPILGGSAADFLLGILFVVAYLKTGTTTA